MNSYEHLMNNKPLTYLRQGQFFVAVIIYSALLLMPDPQLGRMSNSDFVLHALGNAILMMSTWVASGGRYKAMGPFLFVIPFSLIIELAQGLTDNRTPELMDVVANTVGALAGFLACSFMSSLLDKYLNTHK